MSINTFNMIMMFTFVVPIAILLWGTVIYLIINGIRDFLNG